MVSFSSSVSRCDIGEVLPCNGGVRKIYEHQSTPSACSHSPYIFLQKTQGEKRLLVRDGITPACVGAKMGGSACFFTENLFTLS